MVSCALRFRCAVWACVLGPGLGCAPPFLAGLSGCVFCAFFFWLCGVGCWVSLSGALWSVPLSPFFRAGLLAFFFLLWCVSACFGAPLPGWPLFLAPCCRFWLGGPPVPLWGSCLWCLLGGGFGRLLCCWRAVWWLWAVFAPPPPRFFFFALWCPLLGVPLSGLVVRPPIPFLSGWAAGFFFSWCVSACFGAPFHGGPLFLARCCRFWLGGPPLPLPGSCLRCLLGGGFGRLLCCWRAVWWLWAVFAPPPLFFFWGGGGVGCLFLPLPSLGWRTHCGRCVVRLVPRHSWRRFPCATPRHSWLGFAAGGGRRSSPLLAEVPGCGCPPLLAGVRWRRWCVVCGGGVLVGLWLVCGVVGPSPLLAEVPVCYSPPVLAWFRCQWWCAVLATPG